MSTTRDQRSETSKPASVRKRAAASQSATSRKRSPARKRVSACQRAATDPGNLAEAPGAEREVFDEKMQRYRERQASVASILDGLFGGLADCAPELWERRAYLMLVGLVYERLAVDEDEMPTEELVKLAKVLAENRRVEVKLQQAVKDAQSGDSDTESEDNTEGDLPDHLADVVRQVYGTNFQPPEAQTPEATDEQGAP